MNGYIGYIGYIGYNGYNGYKAILDVYNMEGNQKSKFFSIL